MRTLDIVEDSALYQARGGVNCLRQQDDCDFEDFNYNENFVKATRVTFGVGETQTSMQIEINDDIFQVSAWGWRVVGSIDNYKLCNNEQKSMLFHNVQ